MNRIGQHIHLLLALATCSLSLHATAGDGDEVTIDPTAPPPLESLQLKEPLPLKLTAIFGKGEQLHAMINSTTVAVGDSIDGATVLQISQTRVEVERNGEKQWLTLFSTLDIKAAQDKRQERLP